MTLSMNAAHKFGILPSGQRALQASTETHWPRHETMSFHHSPRRLVHAAYDAEQGGLASAITSYQTHIQFRWDGEVYAFQDPLPGAVLGAVSFVNVIDDNHRVTIRRAKRRCRRRPMKILMKANRSEEHTSELQSLMRISYAVFCLKKKKKTTTNKEQYKKTTNR